MRYLVFNNLYDPYSRGGAERIAKLQAEGLASRGHQVRVITTCPATPETFWGPRYEEQGRVGVYYVAPKNIFWYGDAGKHNFFSRLLWHCFDMVNIPSAIAVWRIARQEKPDIAITHNLTGLGFLTPLVLRVLRIRRVHILHDVQLWNPSGLMMKGKETSWMNAGFFSWVYRMTMRVLWGSPDAVLSPSVWLLREHEQRGFFSQSKKEVLLNPAPESVSVTERTHSTNGLRLLFVGQLETHKGILWLIDALKKLPRSDVSLNIIGSGSAEARAKAMAGGDERIRFLGRLTKEEVNRALTSADAVVVPSLCYENSPTVIYESFALGVPVIASNIGGIPELVREGETGWLFPAGNVEVFLRVLKNVMANPTLVHEYGKNARLFIREYGLEKYVENLEKLTQ